MYKRRKPLKDLSRKQLRRIARIESQHDIIVDSFNSVSHIGNQQHSPSQIVSPSTGESSSSDQESEIIGVDEQTSDYHELYQMGPSCNEEEEGDLRINVCYKDDRNEEEGNLRINVCCKDDIWLKQQIAEWVVRNQIKTKPTSELLKILQSYGVKDLPSDGRTLINTPRSTIVKKVHPGEYWHAGIARSIIDNVSISSQILNCEKLQCIELCVGFDGLPLAKSSNSCLWPILGKVINFKSDNTFVIGVYHGQEKPSCANDYMKDFIDEFLELSNTGLSIGGINFQVKLKYVICDAPAKSFILKVKGHSGYSSCTKCTIVGSSIQKTMSFSDSQLAAKRTDADFINQCDPDYHCGFTDLIKIPNFGLVTNIPLDYMHLVCLGVMRKLMNLWIFGDKRLRAKDTFYRLGLNEVNSVSKALESLKLYVPKEFARKPRSLREVKHWKATEYRQILLYTGIVVLKNSIHDLVYVNFVYIHVAIRILCSDLCKQKEMLLYADQLLKTFVKAFSVIYGKRFVSHNVHGLTHLLEDVDNFGPLDNFSAFSFENAMQVLKKYIRKSDKPLQQLSRRIFEKKSHDTERQHVDSLECHADKSSVHFNGPLIDGCKGPQYIRVQFKEALLVCNSKADSCFKLNNSLVVVVENVAQQGRDMVIIGRSYRCVNNLFDDPCPSSLVEVSVVSNLEQELKAWPVTQVKKKMFKIPYGENYVVLPILHSDIGERSSN